MNETRKAGQAAETRKFTEDELYELRQLLRRQIGEAEARLERLDASGAPWRSEAFRGMALEAPRAELALLRRLRRAVR